MTVASILITVVAMSVAPAAGAESGSLSSNDGIMLTVGDPAAGSLNLRISGWEGFALDRLMPKLRANDKDAAIEQFEQRLESGAWTLTYRIGGVGAFTLRVSPDTGGGLRIESSLANTSGGDIVLNDVQVLATNPDGPGASFGANPGAVRIFEQGNYWGRVVPLEAREATEKKPGAGEPTGDRPRANHTSDFVSVAYDRASRKAFLAGFESSERWSGRILIEPAPRSEAYLWRLAFDGGDLVIRPDETVRFENVVLLAGEDAWRLLETYGDLVARLHPVQLPPTPPVSWCSWYPYRLGVTEDRVLETARIAS
ncbi:MAG: hypothetical protein NTZ09_17030, partial [Candidatus Hydrogenedentes bacterium]|nr:hypothetical protein [Candidatus Hydrogenedentota bacterium]